MDGPETRRQCAELNTFHAALFDERDRILKVVVSILSAIRREDATRRHWLAVYCFNHTELVSTDLDQGNFADHFFKRKLDKVQAWLKHVGLNTDFAFRGYHTSRRHSSAPVPAFFDCDFPRTDVHGDSVQDDEENDQENECDKAASNHNWDVQIFHGLSLSKFNWVIVDS